MDLKHIVLKFINELGASVPVNNTTPLPIKVSGVDSIPIEISNSDAIDINIDNETAISVAIDSIPTINTQIVEDATPTYLIAGVAQTNTAAGQAIAVCSGSTKQTKVRKIVIVNPGTQTTPGWRTLTIKRMTTAVVLGDGAPISPFRLDQDGPGFSGTAWEGATDGTAGDSFTFSFWVPNAATNSELITVWPIAGIDSVKNKDIVIPVGVTHGLAVDDSGAAGASGFSIMMEITEEVVA